MTIRQQTRKAAELEKLARNAQAWWTKKKDQVAEKARAEAAKREAAEQTKIAANAEARMARASANAAKKATNLAEKAAFDVKVKAKRAIKS